MKYCLFEDGDVVGPFDAGQLLLRPGFGPACLVSPEEHSDEEAYWKEAACYADFPFGTEPHAEEPAAEAVSSVTETADTVSAVAEFSAEGAAVPEPESPLSLSIDETDAAADKNSPIEEYFNTIKGGDLGNILGIPDPKENSDMNLSRVIESQFEKTDPVLAERKEEGTSEEMISFAQESSANEPVGLKEAEPAEALPASVPDETAAPAAVLDSGISDSAPLTPPVREASGQTAPQNTDAVSPSPVKRSHFPIWKWGMFSGVLLFSAFVFWLHLKQEKIPSVPLPSAVPLAAVAVSDPVTEVPPAKPLAPVKTAPKAPAPASVKADPLNEATEIVQHYALSDGRGTIGDFLDRHYADELASGYSAAWSAEPLHQDAYVVKYRLAKTRKEPVVYVFQVNTAKKKLTGALNNITLDLVGKIN